MKEKRLDYEWDLETWDEHGDIIDHEHQDKLSDFRGLNDGRHLVLVRTYWDADFRDHDRSWAYVEDGKLPEYFTDVRGCEIAKVPQKFHNELTKALKSN